MFRKLKKTAIMAIKSAPTAHCDCYSVDDTSVILGTDMIFVDTRYERIRGMELILCVHCGVKFTVSRFGVYKERG